MREQRVAQRQEVKQRRRRVEPVVGRAARELRARVDRALQQLQPRGQQRRERLGVARGLVVAARDECQRRARQLGCAAAHARLPAQQAHILAEPVRDDAPARRLGQARQLRLQLARGVLHGVPREAAAAALLAALRCRRRGQRPRKHLHGSLGSGKQATRGGGAAGGGRAARRGELHDVSQPGEPGMVHGQRAQLPLRHPPAKRGREEARERDLSHVRRDQRRLVVHGCGGRGERCGRVGPQHGRIQLARRRQVGLDAAALCLPVLQRVVVAVLRRRRVAAVPQQQLAQAQQHVGDPREQRALAGRRGAPHVAHRLAARVRRLGRCVQRRHELLDPEAVGADELLT